MDPTCGLVDKFRDLVFKLTWEQLRYLIYFHRNIDQLNGQLEDLTHERISVQHRTDEAKNNAERIEQNVLDWLGKVDAISEQVHKLRRESEAKLERGMTSCPNLWLRYKLSKGAERIAREAAKICGHGNFVRVSYLDPPQSIPELTNRESNKRIDSRVGIKNQLMEALRNPRFNMIGLCGLGGVGKTTIAKDIQKEEKNQEVFKKVIMATVSQEMNIELIQDQIIEKLGMQLNERTEEGKAFRLYKRLENEKNMLLILDDLWQELDLGRVGIPFFSVENYSKKNEGCKILLTSRKKSLLLDHMECQKIVEVGVLLDDEPWELFQSIAKISIETSSLELKSIATEIVQKCGGLPLAIATAAKALKDKNIGGWRDYLSRLKHSLVRSITGIKEVHNVVKLSYEDLSEENKDIFLLSAMLSHDPSIEDLLIYSVGLDILKHTQNMGDAHDAIFEIVGKLKSLNLFLESFSSHHFTMHDVFRDFALSIAREKLNAVIVSHSRLNEWPDEIDLERCRGICLQESDICDLPVELHGPILEFFFLNSKKSDLTIPNMFFKSSKMLKVLAITKVNFSSLLSLSFLQRLKALCLHSCLLEDITEIRSLRKLKVLSLAYSEIQRLPVELAELTFLQMLNLSHCSKLKVIPQKLLSSLKKLEVLYMGNSFKQWKVEESSKADENASLDELMDLPISSLEIHIPNLSMLPENLFLKMNLRRYRIFIGETWTWQSNYGASKILKLELESGNDLTAGLQNLSKGVEDLHLYGSSGQENVLYNLDASGFPCLRHLRIESNDDIKYVVLNSAHHEDAFPILKSLELKNLKALENLCDGPNDIVFGQLHTFKMENLPALSGDFCIKDRATKNASNKIFKSLFNTVLLPKLEILELCNLNSLIPLIWDDQILHNSLNNLKTMKVERCGFVKLVPLHVLKSLSNLEELEIRGCNMLEKVFDFEDLNDYYKETDSSSIVVPLQKLKLQSLPKLKNVWSDHYQGNVSFPSLRSIHVSYCESLTSIFPTSIAKDMLSDLEELRIYYCSIDVIVANDQVSESVAIAFQFPRLTSLELHHLPQLTNFYPQRSHTLEWPHLQQLSIQDCDELEIFEKEVSSSSAIYEEESTLNSKYPLFFPDKVLLPKLEILELFNLNSLIPLIWDDQILHNSFNNLKTLKVEGCGFVKLVPLHVLKSLNNLEEVDVKFCNMLEIVFDFEDLNDYYKEMDSSPVVMPLKKLWLHSLPKLKNVWSNHYQGNVSFPSLRCVYVDFCGSLTSIFPASIAKGMLCDLEALKISYCDVDVIVAKDQVSESIPITFGFPKLTSLWLYSLPNLRNFYPQKHALEWPHLKQLYIQCCDELEIFDRKEVSGSSEIYEEENVLDSKYPLLSHDKVIGSLERFTLKGKEVEKIGCGQFLMYHFPKLKQLYLILDKEPSSISPEGFLNLGELTLRGDLEKALGSDTVAVLAARFPKLTLQSISIMGSLSPSLVSSPNLTHLNVTCCDELTTLMTSSIARSLVHLTHLSVGYCYKMEEIVTKQEGEDDGDKEIFFRKLEFLKLDYLRRLKRFCGYNYTFIFPLLEHVPITNCPRLTMFCPGAIHAPQLQSVRVNEFGPHKDIWMTDLNYTIQHLFTFKEVISTCERMAINAKNITMITDVFPKVKSLYVESFTDEGVTFPYSSLERFPMLKWLYVEHCSFEEIFPSQDQIIGRLWKDDSQLPPIHQNLEVLEVKSCCSLVKLAPSSASFQNLRSLSVFGCHQLIHLVTTSTTKSLVSLGWLEINDCKRMVEIVMNETNEDVQSGVTFNQLQKIKLTDMPSLKMFSSQSDTFKFPELEKIEIIGCPEMKMFCRGVLETPKLSKVKIEEHDMKWKDEGDLNKTIETLSPAKGSINI